MASVDANTQQLIATITQALGSALPAGTNGSSGVDMPLLGIGLGMGLGMRPSQQQQQLQQQPLPSSCCCCRGERVRVSSRSNRSRSRSAESQVSFADDIDREGEDEEEGDDGFDQPLMSPRSDSSSVLRDDEHAGIIEFAAIGTNAMTSSSLQTYTMILGGNQLGPSSIWYDPDLLSVRLEYADIKRVSKVGTIGIIEVWKGRHMGEDVVFRWLADAHKSMENAVALAMEVKTMTRLEHPKITLFVGVAWSSAMRVQAVSEFMDGGNLGTLLSGLDATQLTWAERKCQVALDVTEALVYLHSLTGSHLARRSRRQLVQHLGRLRQGGEAQRLQQLSLHQQL